MEWERRTSFVFVKTYPDQVEAVYNKLTNWKNVMGVYMTTGPYDLVAWIDTGDTREAYNWVSEVRTWDEVEWTSTYQTYYGYRNESWYWEKPAVGWFRVRYNDLQAAYEELKSSGYVSYVASTSGDYDWMGMFYGDNYNEIYDYVTDLKNRGYEIEFYPVLRYYWNKNYQTKWQQFQTVKVGARTR